MPSDVKVSAKEARGATSPPHSPGCQQRISNALGLGNVTSFAQQRSIVVVLALLVVSFVIVFALPRDLHNTVVVAWAEGSSARGTANNHSSSTINLHGDSWCGYGTLPATWVSSSSGPGNHWHTFNEDCQIRDLLASYSRPDMDMKSHIKTMNASAVEPPLTILDPDNDQDGDLDDTTEPAAAPTASIMFISDSVDRYIMTYLCEHAGGRMRAIVLRDALLSITGSTAADTSAARSASALQGVSAANASGYVVNTCTTPSGRLRLLGSYFPGVHPTGPYHKQRKLSFKQRIDHATTVWRTVSSQPPDIVVVSAMLWDLARMASFEPWLVSGQELSQSLLDEWVLNYTRVVLYAQAAVPEASMFVYHTAMPPRYNFQSGVMDKAYLGRANYVRQLNAAGRHMASQLGLEVIDYAAVASRFQEGQTYLADLIHPGPEVGLELANLYLNYVEQLKAGPRGKDPRNRPPADQDSKAVMARRGLWARGRQSRAKRREAAAWVHPSVRRSGLRG